MSFIFAVEAVNDRHVVNINKADQLSFQSVANVSQLAVNG